MLLFMVQALHLGFPISSKNYPCYVEFREMTTLFRVITKFVLSLFRKILGNPSCSIHRYIGALNGPQRMFMNEGCMIV